MTSTSRRRPRMATLVLAAGSLAFAGCGGDSNKAPEAAGRPDCPALDEDLPGLRTGEAPWPAELRDLGERLDALGLPRLTQEGSATDWHILLSVVIDGTKVTVPASIGLNGEEVAGGRMVSGFVSALHTHDNTGVVHIHSPDVRRYTLGQLFDIWGVTLTAERIGGYCTGAGRTISVTANGEAFAGDPRELDLVDQQEITLTYA